ncbi:lycopene cyclase domain-containing protein [Arthrobacter zhaoxinii]|uniref:Lycopene cyclase domain-containing protein n=1 Tax=Arthrobacter zhaoxinii TaxID=2964616 RepID=A0ABY5YVU2_9MICC|nr:lycopene cyclase domain-containing protein [Arthrobacter zhaoxinii]
MICAVVLLRGHRPRYFVSAAAVTGVVLLALTAVFDNLMIRVGLFWYNEHRISGAFAGAAPLEDFAYPLAAVLLLPALWVLLPGRAPGPGTSARKPATRKPTTKEQP